jgi:hypothetical protein
MHRRGVRGNARGAPRTPPGSAGSAPNAPTRAPATGTRLDFIVTRATGAKTVRRRSDHPAARPDVAHTHNAPYVHAGDERPDGVNRVDARVMDGYQRFDGAGALPRMRSEAEADRAPPHDWISSRAGLIHAVKAMPARCVEAAVVGRRSHRLIGDSGVAVEVEGRVEDAERSCDGTYTSARYRRRPSTIASALCDARSSSSAAPRA